MLHNTYKKHHSAIKQADIRDILAKASKKVNPTQITEEITIEDDNPRPSTQREPEPQAGPSFIPTEYEAEHMADDPLSAMPDSDSD